MPEPSTRPGAEKDAGRIDALRIESDGGVLILATRHDGQIEARTSSDRIVLDREAVVRLADWLTKHDPHAESDAAEPEWVRRAVTLHDHFDGRITLRVAQPQPQYNTVQLNAEYKGDLISVDVDIDDLRAALAAVDTRVLPPAIGGESDA